MPDSLVFFSIIEGSNPDGVRYTGTLEATVELTQNEDGTFHGTGPMSLTGFTFVDPTIPADCSITIGAVGAEALAVNTLSFEVRQYPGGSGSWAEVTATIDPFLTNEEMILSCRGIGTTMINHLISGSFANLHQAELLGGRFVFRDWELEDSASVAASVIAASKEYSGSSVSGDTTVHEETSLELRW